MSSQVRTLQEIKVLDFSAPVAVEGLGSSWPAFGLLGSAALRSRRGGLPVQGERRQEQRTFRVDEFLDQLSDRQEPEPWYVSNWAFRSDMPEVVEGIILPACVENWLEVLPEDVRPDWLWLFIGGAGTATPLHLDTVLSSACNVVIEGRKRWRFLSPALGLDRGILPDVFAPIVGNGPREMLTYVQKPGDFLVTPSGWTHSVVNEEPTIAVTGNFVNASNIQLVRTWLQLQGDADLQEFLEVAAAASHRT